MTTDLGFKNAKDLGIPWTHWFFYGDTGSGKTTLAATFPRPCFILPKNEGSIATLRGQNIPYYEVVDMDRTELIGGVGGMRQILDRLENAYLNDIDNFPFDTIVIENLTHYADLVIEQLTGGKKQMDQFQWGLLAGHMRSIQARLRAMDVNAVYTALAEVDKTDDITVGGPYIQGQTAKKLPASCDVIGYCEEYGGGNNVQSKRRVHFRKYKCFPARSRFQGLPAVVENFNFDAIKDCLV